MLSPDNIAITMCINFSTENKDLEEYHHFDHKNEHVAKINNTI